MEQFKTYLIQVESCKMKLVQLDKEIISVDGKLDWGKIETTNENVETLELLENFGASKELGKKPHIVSF